MKMRVLLIWPPENRTFLSTYRHFSHFGGVAGYLRRQYPEYQIKLVDGAVVKLDEKALTEEFCNNYDVVVMQIEPYNLESAQKTIALCKAVAASKVIAFGGMCGLNPRFLLSGTLLDAVCHTGNWEYGVARYIEHVMGGIKEDDLRDVCYRTPDAIATTPVGPMVLPEDWCLPPFDWMPVSRYNPFTNHNHQSEARVLASRGCPFICSFCRTSYTGTRRVVHREPAAIARDIVEVHDRYGNDIDKYNLVAANFTANRLWALAVCRAMRQLPFRIRWCTMSRVSLLDEELVSQMAESGCWKVGLGIETLSPTAQATINKRFEEEVVERGVLLLRKYGIVARTCIMLGIPGQSREDILYTFLRLQDWGASIRPKEYYPFQQLTAEGLTMETVRRFDRSQHYLNPVPGLEKALFMRLINHGRVLEDDIRPIIAAEAVVLKQSDHESSVLLVLDDGGQYSLPHGVQRQGEALGKTAERGTIEQAGLRTVVQRNIGKTLNVHWSTEKRLPTAETTHYFLAIADDGGPRPDLTSSKLRQPHWRSLKDASTLLSREASDILQRVTGIVGDDDPGPRGLAASQAVPLLVEDSSRVPTTQA
jgi:anaerobic magnesium-protoporphyrin IX monomethyl ester cyclase